MADEKPNYYAIIPADVRYNRNLTPNAKLLFCEITALCSKEGKCWATNKYFAELYNVSIPTISVWIKSLIDAGYIRSNIIYKDGTKEILNRYLEISKEGYLEKSKEGIKKNLKDNNTSINNTSINKKKVNKEKPTLEDVKEYIKEKELNVDAEQFFNYFEEGNWTDSKGYKVRNWKQKLLTWNRYTKKPVIEKSYNYEEDAFKW